MFLRKRLLFFALFGLLICTGEATAGPNANAVLSLDLIADGGVGNERDDGVTSGTVSGQGTKIAVEVFAKGVTTSLVGVRIEFDFDASVLTYVGARNSVFLIFIPEAIGTVLATPGSSPVTLSESGFLARAEFTTTVDVTGREFSIGIKRVVLAGDTNARPVEDEITTTEVIRFNAASSPDFNNDGIVDLADYGLFRLQWDTRAGGPNWDAKFDLNGDGVIDLGDYDIFRDNWNKTFPVSPSDGSDDEEIVSIPDMNLRAVVEDSLGKASGETITREEMATLTRFAAVNANISDVTGLEFATNLTALALVNNSITDLSPLSGLTNLASLTLDRNTITDISPLSGLTSLTRLYLFSNSIVDISPLSNLTSLTSLWIQNNSIVDISPLVANTGLDSGDEVDVRSNPLNATSINTHIPALQDRGVEVSFDPAPDPTPVNIPDANLRAAIEDALDKSSGETITRGDMSTLTRLEAPNANISDLTGLEFATNLTSLNFDPQGSSKNSNSISDLSPLEDLTNLRSLNLQQNTISDLSPLSELTSLTVLELGNPFGGPSLSPSFSGNTITDISPLSNLTNLTVLGLSGNTITDISPLSNLTNLTTLNLFGNTITDISPLSGLTNLITLYLQNNLIVDISPLSGLTNLTELGLANSNISIPGLVLSNNTISDLAPLVANTGLGSGDRVDVRNNPLSATSINTHIPALQSRGVAVLFIIDDPTPVSIPDANLRAEIEDALDKASGETITRGDMSNLTEVSAGSANISDLTGLEFATNLLSLYLFNNTISDVSSLSGLTSLTSLTLRRNSITDISPLSGLTNLSRLRLEENSITDVSALSGLTNLTSLLLYSNRISDLSPLVANTGLGSGDRVDVRDNPLSDASINTHIPALQDRGVTVRF